MCEGLVRTKSKFTTMFHRLDGGWRLEPYPVHGFQHRAPRPMHEFHHWLKSQIFLPLSRLAPLFRVTPSNLWKSFTVPETRVFRAVDGENLVILACTVFDWSTCVTDGRTELRWLRRAITVPAVVRKNNSKTNCSWILYGADFYEKVKG